MTVYEDERGWQYKVHNYGQNYKALYRKKESLGWHGCRGKEFQWRKSEAEAQADLDAFAARKGLKVVQEEG